MSDKTARWVCVACVAATALASGLNLALTLEQRSSMSLRAADWQARRAAQDARLDRIETTLVSIDADIDTHKSLMQDLEALRTEVQALQAQLK